MWLFFALFLLSCCCATDPPTSKAAFEDFVKQFGRQYASKEEVCRQFASFWGFGDGLTLLENQHSRRFELFRKNMARAAELNGLSKSAHFGVTKFADWSAEEIRNVFVSAAEVWNATLLHKSVPPPKSAGFPSSLNYTALDRVALDMWDQGALASGAAFALAAETDGNFRLLKPDGGNGCDLCPCPCDECCMCGMYSGGGGGGVCRATSGQEAIDCGTYSVPGRVYDQVKALGGWASVSTHPPFRPTAASSCGVQRTQIVYVPTGLTQYLPMKSAGQMQTLLYEHGPVTVAINGDALAFYTGGILDANVCSAPADIYQYVTLTAYSTDPRSQKVFFEAKNSFSKRWGTLGYMRVWWDACDVLQYPYSTSGRLPIP